jgi:putative oxidoreductase
MVTTATKAPAPAHRSRVRSVLAALLSTRTAPLPTDIALIAVRTALAWIFIYHGARRLFGWFGGIGLDRSATYFANTAGLRPGTLFAVISGVIEFGGGIAIAFGFASRLAGAAIFGDMVMAMITVTWGNGINYAEPGGGYEINLAFGVLALVIAIFGAGRFSVDALLERRLLAAEARAPA